VFFIILIARRVSRNEAALKAWWALQLQRPRVVAFREKHQPQLAFLQARVDPAGVFGLYLTLGLAVTLAMGWALGSAVQDLFAREGLALIDTPIGRFFQTHQSPVVTRIMHGVTQLGGPYVVIGVLALAALLAVERAKSIRPGVFLLSAVAGGYLLDKVLKSLVMSIRPAPGLSRLLGSSFPSGHTVGAATLYGAIAFIVSRFGSSWPLRVWAWVTAVLLVLVVGTSRIYLGTHYASDVAGGAALGGMWLGACCTGWLAWDRLSDSRSLETASR